MRLQLALNVKDLDSAVDFYSKLFGVEPRKRKPGYANFAIAEPPFKLVLFEAPSAGERLNHLGVEVFDDADVSRAEQRIRTSGLPHLTENDTICCNARQNKVWALEPQGLRWEWYRVIEDVKSEKPSPGVEAAAEDCCDVDSRISYPQSTPNR